MKYQADCTVTITSTWNCGLQWFAGERQWCLGAKHQEWNV